MKYTCEWCACETCDSVRMVELMRTTCGCTVCYECMMEWVSEPMVTVDLEVTMLEEWK